MLDPFGSHYSARRNPSVTMVQPAMSFRQSVEVASISGLKLPVELLLHNVPVDLLGGRIGQTRIPLPESLSWPRQVLEIDVEFGEERWFVK